jgi:RNase P/RNase MRP subunit p30
MSELPGVYCVNSGFTVFKVAIVLKQNDEYFVLKNNVSKGVELYDRIVLDASKYSEGQLIY